MDQNIEKERAGAPLMYFKNKSKSYHTSLGTFKSIFAPNYICLCTGCQR